MKVLYPLTLHKVLDTGANRPIVVRASDKEGNKEDIVVKLLDSERMDALANMKESIASCLARQLKINSPEPYIAEVTEEFALAIGTDRIGQRLVKSVGFNFASKLIEGAMTIGFYDALNGKQLESALRIFYFDLLIQNPDRNIKDGKPNLLTTGDDLWIIDHELAFSFLFAIIGQKKADPWVIDIQDLMVQNHVLFQKLKGKVTDFSSLEGFLDPISDIFWAHLIETFPDQWILPELEAIREHISIVQKNQEKFVEMIKKLLA